MNITFVLGGTRSGKSRYAEALCGGGTYIATAEAIDREMKARIEAHQSRRGAGWQTVEAPYDLVGALRAAKGLILVDCLTLWLTNLIVKERNAEAAIDELVAYLAKAKQKIIIVSNELGLGLVPEGGLARHFRDVHGLMNQRVSEVAGTVIFCVAGNPLIIKGRKPVRPKPPSKSNTRGGKSPGRR